MASYALWALAAAGVAQAAVTPTAPGPGQSFNEGSTCTIQWTLDTTSTWKNVSIDLMTGSNFNMVLVENVVSGLDGTSGNGTYEWTCPNVTPNSDIYFYQFANNGADPTWTTRFTIASANGDSTPPTNATAQGSTTISWGTGHLATGAAAASASSASRSASRTASAAAVSATDSSNSDSSSSSSTSSSSSSTSSSPTQTGSSKSTTSGAAPAGQAKVWVAGAAVVAGLAALVL